MMAIRELLSTQFLRFLLVGGSGALLNLVVSWGAVKYWLGMDMYLMGSALGLIVNIIYNFFAYSYFAFNSRQRDLRTFIVFLVYSMCTIIVYLSLLRIAVSFMGPSWYLVASAVIIGVLAIVNFFIAKTAIFIRREV